MEINIIFNKINSNKRRKILNFEDENESIIQIPKTINLNIFVIKILVLFINVFKGKIAYEIV